MNDFLPTPDEIAADLWERLAQADKPVVLYGMGNGADKILAVLERCGVEAADFFASDGFVRGHAFHGKVVLTYAEVAAKYEDFIVLLSFGSSLPEVLARFDALDAEREVYAPDVPVVEGGALFTRQFYEENYDKFRAAYDLLCDEESKRIFGELVRYKLTGNLGHLRAATSAPGCERAILDFAHYETMVDAGAYTGDTARKFIADCPHAKTVYAIEPDRRSYKKLTAYAEGETAAKVLPYRFCAWSEKGDAAFAAEGNRNSAAKAGGYDTVALDTVDSLGAPADYIKYDVEGAERAALLGSRETILRCHPDLLVSAYHRSEDLYDLPLLLHEQFPFYELRLRRFPYVPAWDINLYATVSSIDKGKYAFRR